ncbi:MAG: TIGR00159 family protein [Chlamydiae bacterium]|nr:TIGR00159 family protein [Chlamydiota bacterium]
MSSFSQFIPFLEIFIITMMANYLLSFFWNTRSMDLILGLLAYLLIYAVSFLLGFPILQKIMLLVANVAVIAILIIFQPELRVALSKLSLKSRRYKELSQFDKFLEQLTNSIYRLAEKRTGALIVLENEDSLKEYANKAVILNAVFSSELLESIFTPTTPLHDGAVIIRDTTIVAAAVIAPLAEDSTQLTKSMGTRHRAGLGLSQISDALVIVISEESGRVSIARDGMITRGVKMDRFKGVVRSVFTEREEETFPNRFNLFEWLKR